MTPIRIELLGNLRITQGSHPIASVNTKRLQSLLAYLVLHADAALSRERVAFLLWPESSESQARTNLRQLLHNLRRALPAECCLLSVDNQTVQWRPDAACTLDVADFEAAVVRAAEAEKQGDLAAVRDALSEAARLYQDDLLPGLYDEWLQPKREQLRQQLALVLNSLAELLEKTGDYEGGIHHAERLVAQDPLREPYYQLLIRLHARNQDRSSALRVYHQCMRALKRELGVSPDKATQALFTQILKSEPLGSPPMESPPHAAPPSPMVGRKTEWERLLGCWRQVTDGEPRLALILGEPGIGKSRLAEELFQSCSLPGDAAAARARCYDSHGHLAYAPVAEWLRAPPLRTALALLPKSQLAELARVLPEILVENPDIPPPPPLTESWQRHHFYEALNAVFGKAPKPLLLLIDDLQWCDRDSLEWLHSLFRSRLAGRILALGTVRPEETGRDHPLTGLLHDLRQSGQLVEVPLAPLNGEETATLAAQIASREFDAAFLNNLYQITKGNPLFVVESVRAGLEEQQQASATPPRIQAVIAARLAQLSPPAYDLAGFAAAIGSAFSFDLLVKATDWDEDSVSRALEELWQRRIVDGQGAGVYDYTHGLLREVAYAELSEVRRRFLHRRIARALEELHAVDIESVSGRLAAHYEAAGMADQAMRSYSNAAAVARQRYAYTESAELLRKALVLCRDFPETAQREERELELLVTLGLSLVTTQGYSTPEVGETYSRALSLSRQLGQKKHVFPVLTGAWVFHVVRGQLETSLVLAQQCLDMARREDAAALLAAGHFVSGSSLFHFGRFAESREHMEQALAAYPGGSDSALALFAGPDVGVFCRSYLPHVVWQLGFADEAAAMSNQALASARELSHPFSLAIALDYSAMLYVFRQESKQTLERAEEAASLCRRYGFAYYLAWADVLTGWAKAVEGDATAGLAILREGLDALKATGAEVRLPFYYGLLAQVCGLAGRDGEALASISSGFAFQSKNGEIWAASELHRIHGDLLLHSGKVAEARASYQRAVDAARQTGARSYESRASASLCGLLAPQNAGFTAP
jgi:DNA-binding SARP family transcriptional activator/predicted ATPase